ncbi:PDZ domain-containing protein [Alkalicella caledoniensis]|uniref:PDZ domain-containing protein n=1 Tax=Alkalicella caledoniensis TaxID=2731377 RepID=A0A7G9W6Y0_ALKCA|nr:PDZ domain-containing protein [Alkalicella caledoniensis]QNO14442.1 PDZ domain-containing protein [Alkalicella caledoniensis]
MMIQSLFMGLMEFRSIFPILLLVVLFMVKKQYNRQMLMERRLFGISITNPTRQTITSLIFGFLGGLIGSIMLVFIGVDIAVVGLHFAWPIAILLMLYNPRYMCFSYAGGIVGVASLLARGILSLYGEIELTGIALQFVTINLPGLMAVVGILHLTESVLIYLSGAKGASPMFLKHNDKVVGGFTLQRFWPVPIVALVAAAITTGEAAGGSIAMPNWWPLINSNLTAPDGYTITYIMFPIIAALGYGDLALSTHPKEKSKKTALSLFLYSVSLVGLAVLAAFYPVVTVLPVLFAPLAHEFLIVVSNNREFKGEPLFVAPKEGIMVLSVIKGSVAEKMGIQSGYVITRVNGTYVEDETHFKELLVALDTYAKFEIIDNNGSYRHVQAPLFGRRRQMGLIIIPKNPEHAVTMSTESPLENLWKKITKEKAS